MNNARSNPLPLETLRTPTPAYKRHVWLAMAALVLFVATYGGLTIWLVVKSYQFMAAAYRGANVDGFAVLAAMPLLCVAIFMIGALFVKQRQTTEERLLITRTEEPALFDFIQSVADEAGAPRPSNTYLVPDVNASVAFDVSVLNLIYPSKKNLNIGIGLVNSLCLSEFRAVLAHEFGHFAQKSMAIGRWVYTAQRVAEALVTKRGRLDDILFTISRLDPRIAWIGWGMRVIIWALRSVMDTLFSIVVLAERALSREMEMQADLVSVSLAGSDAIVHALAKMGPADTAFDEAFATAIEQLHKRKKVRDLYKLQSVFLEQTRAVLGDDNYGRPPAVPNTGPDAHRVFERRLASPPRMWSTHPPNDDREVNAKRNYVPRDEDARTAWTVFADPEATRARVTAFVLTPIADKLAKALEDQEDVDEKITFEETDGLAAVDQQFRREYFSQKYKGIYVARPSTRHAPTVSELSMDPMPEVVDWKALYTEEMAHEVKRLKALEVEHGTLVALSRGILRAKGKSIHFRGRVLRPKELPTALAELKSECDVVRARVSQNDKAMRSAHLSAATALGNGWADYLRSLAALVHYAEHTAANLADAAGAFRNVFSIVIADGSVSNAERARLCKAGVTLHQVIKSIDDQKGQVLLPTAIQDAAKVTAWQEMLPEEFRLYEPVEVNILEWCGVIEGWISVYASAINNLADHALEALLNAEALVMQSSTDEKPASDAPAQATVPEAYETFVWGRERDRQWKLPWLDRFKLADGFIPTVARLAVAGSIVLGCFSAATVISRDRVFVHNGLARRVTVTVGDQTMTVEPRETTEVSLDHVEVLKIRTTVDLSVVVEEFEQRLVNQMDTYVYNVAEADRLWRWTATYGNAQPEPYRSLGMDRWLQTDAFVFFEDPPQTEKLSPGGGALRVVIDGCGGDPDETLRGLTQTQAERTIEQHARWDHENAEFTSTWVEMAQALKNAKEIAGFRLKLNAMDVPAFRLEQELGSGADHDAVCAQQRELLGKNPQEPNLLYLDIRCMPDSPAQAARYQEEAIKHPTNPWLSYAWACQLADAGDWKAALPVFERSVKWPQLPSRVAVDYARIVKLQGHKAKLSELLKKNPRLSLEAAVLDGEADADETVRAYEALRNGNLEAAMKLVPSNSGQHDRMLRLVSASQGASDALINESLALAPDAGLDDSTVWGALGLAIRRARPIEPYVDYLEKNFDRTSVLQIRAGIEHFARSGAFTDLETQIAGLHFVIKAHVFVMAVVADPKSPAAWRELANGLLFPTERPWL